MPTFRKSSLIKRRNGFQDIWIINESDLDYFAAYANLLLNFYDGRAGPSIRSYSGSRSFYSNLDRSKGCPVLITSRVAMFENFTFSGRGHATRFPEMRIFKLSTSDFAPIAIQSIQSKCFREISISDPQLVQFAKSEDIFVLSPLYMDDAKILDILRNSRLIIIDKERKRSKIFQAILEAYEGFLTPKSEIMETIHINAELLRSYRFDYLCQIIRKLYYLAVNSNNSDLDIKIQITRSALTTNWIYIYQDDLAYILNAIRILNENLPTELWSFVYKSLNSPENRENGNRLIEAQEIQEAQESQEPQEPQELQEPQETQEPQKFQESQGPQELQGPQVPQEPQEPREAQEAQEG